jgi:hypothetical protein
MKGFDETAVLRAAEPQKVLVVEFRVLLPVLGETVSAQVDGARDLVALVEAEAPSGALVQVDSVRWAQ